MAGTAVLLPANGGEKGTIAPSLYPCIQRMAPSRTPHLLQCTTRPIFIGRERTRRMTMKKTLLSALFARMPSRQDREMEYLNRSVTIYDLERRQREVAQGKFRNF